MKEHMCIEREWFQIQVPAILCSLLEPPVTRSYENMEGSGPSCIDEGPTPIGKRTVKLQQKTCHFMCLVITTPSSPNPYNIHLLQFLPTSATHSSYFLRLYSTAITESSIFYVRSIVKEYPLRQPARLPWILCEGLIANGDVKACTQWPLSYIIIISA